ncbi:MAG: hypothetical protein ABSA27_11020 [Terriglobales bacterium]|jgi:nicotinamide riboside transporter PnuC
MRSEALVGFIVEEYSVNSEKSTSRTIAWGPWITVAIGGLLFLVGAARFVTGHRFGFIDAFHCCLAVIPAALLLLILTYVVQHARLVSVIPLFVAGVLVFTFPVFDVAVGAALMGAIAVPALSDWKNEKRLRKSTTAHDC